MTDDPQRLAEAVGKAMYARDRAAQALGITLEAIGPGFARMAMVVREDMLNGHDICHGGMTFALADTAFAYACNAFNEVTVASSCDITFTAPARRDDRLTAEAVEQSRSGRTGVYDITVTNQDGRKLALFRGRAYRLGGPVTSTEAP